MSSSPSLVGYKLGCIRGDTPVFKDINFQLYQGESLHIVGPNGVGKSSLLRMIAGLLPVSAGELKWSQSAHTLPPCVLINHKQGLKPYMTVQESIYYWLQLSNNTALNTKQILDLWGLSPLADFPISILSQGQRQRLSLCRLQIFSTELWLLDEPFLGLDLDGQKVLCQLMHQHQEQGGCIIIASHQAVLQAWQPTHCLDLSLHSLVRNAA